MIRRQCFTGSELHHSLYCFGASRQHDYTLHDATELTLADADLSDPKRITWREWPEDNLGIRAHALRTNDLLTRFKLDGVNTGYPGVHIDRWNVHELGRAYERFNPSLCVITNWDSLPKFIRDRTVLLPEDK